jgi:hypothetical protein
LVPQKKVFQTYVWKTFFLYFLFVYFHLNEFTLSIISFTSSSVITGLMGILNIWLWMRSVMGSKR